MSTTAHPTTSATSTARLAGDELRAWRGLLRSHTALVKALDAQLTAAHSLPLSSYEVLMHVADAEGGRMRMHDIADSVLLSRSGLTRLVDRLVRDGLLCRESCPSDARGSFAVITPAGRAKLDAARATHLQGVRALFLSMLSGEEQALLADVWDRVLRAAGEDPDAHTACDQGC
jgi:DNA-binding MarR family transcriptional regulator